MTQKRITVVIPAYNEREVITDNLRAVIRFLEQKAPSYEIIVVDDGSTDDTVERITEIMNKNVRLLRNRKNSGKGFSVKQGVLASSGELVLITDADLSTPMEELEKLLAYIKNGSDIAIGSRALARSEIMERQNILRESMGRMFNLLVRMMGLSSFHDTQCGFKLFKGNAAREIFARCSIDRFAFDVEVLFIARKMGFTIGEAPIVWSNHPRSRVRIIKDSLNMLMDILRIRFNDSIGKYDMEGIEN